METKTITVYSFNELSDKVKQKVLNENYDVEVNYNWWRFLEEEFKDELKKIGIEAENIYFSIDRDKYIYLDRATIDSELFINSFLDKDGQILKSLLDENKVLIDVIVTNNSLSNLVEVEISDEDGGVCHNREIDEDLNINSDSLTEYLNVILHNFLKQLEDEYSYRTSEECIIEYFEANEYKFFEDGRLYA